MSIEHTDVLIAGAGLGGARVAEGLRAAGFDGRIVVAGAEQHGPYERPALSKRVLLGECPVSAIGLRPDAYWREHAIELRTGETVDSIDVGARRATAGRPSAAMGDVSCWRRASAPAASPTSRDWRTSTTCAPPTMPRTCVMRCSTRGRLAVIGAGFVGLEAASAALSLGVDVSVVDPAPVPFLTTLGPAVGHLMGQNARDAGVDLRLGTSIARVVSASGHVVALELQDGSRVDCDAVLVGIGSLPNSQIAAGSLALAADRGIITDLSGRTSADGVYACGDVAAARRANGSVNRIEHWSAAAWSARAVAERHRAARPHRNLSPPTSGQISSDAGFRSPATWTPRLDPAMDGAEEGFVAHYRDAAGRLLAVALLDRPEQLSGVRRELIASNDSSPLSSAVL